jgi:hypothetical protein
MNVASSVEDAEDVAISDADEVEAADVDEAADEVVDVEVEDVGEGIEIYGMRLMAIRVPG